ncbi:YuzF family protein [Microaerobacter geothermalis]|uniref:YuzF family protein n=1 Tax=Microaerobacter geothermalis TaxID=674972 RepID=UPI001F3E2936|nr:YuzF family protein [Microaerobacter geothermalis]MCF6093582.1 YuzF family protein [Microaerobacter geothermalis]
MDKDLTFSNLKHFIGRVVGVDRVGHDSVYGRLIAVKPDHLIVYTLEEGFIYYQTEHVKSITTDSKDYTDLEIQYLDDIQLDYVDVEDFNSLLQTMQHRWVQINRGEHECLQGVLCNYSKSYIELIMNHEMIRVFNKHIKNISYVMKPAYEQLYNEQQSSNQENTEQSHSEQPSDNQEKNKKNEIEQTFVNLKEDEKTSIGQTIPGRPLDQQLIINQTRPILFKNQKKKKKRSSIHHVEITLKMKKKGKREKNIKLGLKNIGTFMQIGIIRDKKRSNNWAIKNIKFYKIKKKKENLFSTLWLLDEAKIGRK